MVTTVIIIIIIIVVCHHLQYAWQSSRGLRIRSFAAARPNAKTTPKKKSANRTELTERRGNRGQQTSPPAAQFNGATWRVTVNNSLCLPHQVKTPKPEVRNISHCHQRKTESRPQVTYAENFVKFGHMVFDICERTSRQTDNPIPIIRIPPGGRGKVKGT